MIIATAHHQLKLVANGEPAEGRLTLNSDELAGQPWETDAATAQLPPDGNVADSDRFFWKFFGDRITRHVRLLAKTRHLGANFRVAMNHVWYYLSEGVLDDKTEGPISEQEFVELLKAGKISLKSQVSSPTRTRGKWHQVQSLSSLVRVVNEGKQEREQRREQEKQEKQRALMVVAQEQAQRRAEEQSRVAHFSDCQDMAAVHNIEQKVRPILTQQEVLEYIAVQRTFLILNPIPDGVVVTNRRLIFYRPKFFGAYEFQDYLWLDLFDAHFKQGYLGATFWARHVSGRLVQMDWLPREAVQRLYRIAQEREEQARWARHNLNLQTLRAGAAQVNVQTNNSFSLSSAPPPHVVDAEIIESKPRHGE